MESSPGQGASFKIYLPRFIGEAATPVAPSVVERAPRGHETILLEEDDASVLHLTAHMLQSLGYRVVGVRSSAEAKRIDTPPVDLLLTDVILTEMKGTELARLLQAARPGLRVLFMSGYTDEITFREGVLASGDAFLQKPFARAALAAKVRAVLDAPLL